MNKKNNYIMIYYVSVLVIVGMLTLNRFNIINIIGTSLTSRCTFPYTNSKCSGIINNTVKEAQRLLKQLGYYKDSIDGKYGSKTKESVKKFQQKYKMTQDGNMGIATLKKLAEVTGTRYYTIKYYLNGGTGDLKNTMKSNKVPTQFIFYGVKEKISPTKLTKKGLVHVGWTAKTEWNRTEYEYGCTKASCGDSAKTLTWHARTTRGNSTSNNFYKYYYDIGTTVSHTGSKGNKQVITFTAQYCKTGYKYNKSKSKCEVVATKNNPQGSTTKTTTKTTTKNNSSSNGIFSAKKYSLTNAQVQAIAKLCQQEQGTAKGAAAEASLMANRFELYGKSKYGNSATGLYNYVRNSGWWASASKHMSGTPNKDVLAAVKDVLINGKRTLPLYVDEHDCMNCGDISKIKNGSTIITDRNGVRNRNNYKKDKTIIYNRYGAVYTFYSFPTSTSDPFGYTSNAKNKVSK